MKSIVGLRYFGIKRSQLRQSASFFCPCYQVSSASVAGHCTVASTSNRVISTPVLRLQSPTVLVSEPEARRPSDSTANPCCPDVGCRWNYFNRHIILWYKFPTSLARAACVWPENMLYPGGGYRRIPLYSRGGHSSRFAAALACIA